MAGLEQHADLAQEASGFRLGVFLLGDEVRDAGRIRVDDFLAEALEQCAVLGRSRIVASHHDLGAQIRIGVCDDGRL